MNYEQRIISLERMVRRQRIGMLATTLGLATAMVLGMADDSPKKMTLEELTITHDGTPRIVMGTNEDGGVGVAFLDPKERPRVSIGTDDKDGSGIAILDERQTPKIMIGSGPEGSGIALVGATLTEIPVPPSQKK
ncbi:MAG: hypothetical protein CL849_03025 [Crocinitomicaceae bacterium]|nr:hypothetical protein [Crocinitomicaceae bacterium]